MTRQCLTPEGEVAGWGNRVHPGREHRHRPGGTSSHDPTAFDAGAKGERAQVARWGFWRPPINGLAWKRADG